MPHDPSQVYIPDADTYLLLEAALTEVKPGDQVLEVGTGSGLIAAELARDYPCGGDRYQPACSALCTKKRCGGGARRSFLWDPELIRCYSF